MGDIFVKVRGNRTSPRSSLRKAPQPPGGGAVWAHFPHGAQGGCTAFPGAQGCLGSPGLAK